MEHKLYHQLNLSVSLCEPFLIEFILILSLSDAILFNVFFFVFEVDKKNKLDFSLFKIDAFFRKIVLLEKMRCREIVYYHFDNVFTASFSAKLDNFCLG